MPNVPTSRLKERRRPMNVLVCLVNKINEQPSFQRLIQAYASLSRTRKPKEPVTRRAEK